MVEVDFRNEGQFSHILEAAHFHHCNERGKPTVSINPRLYERFRPALVSAGAIMMYDTKKEEYVTVEIETYGVQRRRVESGDFQTCKAAFERYSPHMLR